MMLSKRCLHGLKAVLYLVGHVEERPYVPIREVAGELDLPFHYLSKILQDLVTGGVLRSSRGVNGGMTLAGEADAVNVRNIIEALEGSRLFEGCILGFEHCDASCPCALHHRWSVLKPELCRMFEEENLSDLVSRIDRDGLRLREAL